VPAAHLYARQADGAGGKKFLAKGDAQGSRGRGYKKMPPASRFVQALRLPLQPPPCALLQRPPLS
jgi:hypothetical protein